MGEVVGFSDLAPGLYQVAIPDEIKTIPAPVALREAEHYWVETKREQQAGQWSSVPKGLHVNTAGLLLQAEAIGAHAHSRVMEMDRSRVHVVAWGYWLRCDGTLEVIEKSKEYDMAAETMKAALKEVRGRDNAPSEQQTTALVKVATEDAALALVGTLPDKVKARVMEARLEVQGHREALCRTKAENQILRYFVQKAGGVVKRPIGQGDVKIELRRTMLMRKLESAEVRAAVDSLYGAPEMTRAEGLAKTEQILRETFEGADGPVIEDAEILSEEGADASEAEAPAGDGGESPWEGTEEPAAATPPAPPAEQPAPPAPTAQQQPAPAANANGKKPLLRPKQTAFFALRDQVFSRPGVAGGKPISDKQAWQDWRHDKLGVPAEEQLLDFDDSTLEAAMDLMRELGGAGMGFGYRTKPQEGGAS